MLLLQEWRAGGIQWPLPGLSQERNGQWKFGGQSASVAWLKIYKQWVTVLRKLDDIRDLSPDLEKLHPAFSFSRRLSLIAERGFQLSGTCQSNAHLYPIDCWSIY